MDRTTINKLNMSFQLEKLYNKIRYTFINKVLFFDLLFNKFRNYLISRIDNPIYNLLNINRLFRQKTIIH